MVFKDKTYVKKIRSVKKMSENVVENVEDRRNSTLEALLQMLKQKEELEKQISAQKDETITALRKKIKAIEEEIAPKMQELNNLKRQLAQLTGAKHTRGVRQTGMFNFQLDGVGMSASGILRTFGLEIENGVNYKLVLQRILNSPDGTNLTKNGIEILSSAVCDDIRRRVTFSE